MPELPEVETYVRELEPELQNRSITGAEVFWERIIAAPSALDFSQEIIGERFVHFGRRGKYMLLGLQSGRMLIVHLRMTGQIHIYWPEVERDKHTHLILDLDDGRRLHYQDQRKFGRIWLVDDAEKVLYRLGPEPFSAGFTPESLAQSLNKRTASIKALLLDQSIVAGVGNIYADEALFLAKIHPRRAGGGLSIEELKRLHGAVLNVLQKGIDLKGSTLQNYIRLGGGSGTFQEEHQVFRKTGEPCPRCGSPIERIVLAQRSTHFCGSCQPLYGNSSISL